MLITKDVLEEVIHTYKPDSLAINHLRGIIMDYIYAYRSNPTDRYNCNPYPETCRQLHSDQIFNAIDMESMPDASPHFDRCPDLSEQYRLALSDGRKILAQLDERLDDLDQRLEQIKSMMVLFNQMEQRMDEFIHEIEIASQSNPELTKSYEPDEDDNEDRPPEYQTPTDKQLLQMVLEEERLQKMLGIWDEADDERVNWVDKPWLKD
jgi:hypothetical protein